MESEAGGREDAEPALAALSADWEKMCRIQLQQASKVFALTADFYGVPKGSRLQGAGGPKRTTAYPNTSKQGAGVPRGQQPYPSRGMAVIVSTCTWS